MLFIMYWVETDDVHAPPVMVDETHCARASVGIYSPERVERLAELGGVDVAVKCLLRGLEEEESDGTLLVDEANFEHVSPAAVVLHALVDSSPARRAEAIRLGALPALVALMRARMAAESEDGVPLGRRRWGSSTTMVKDDPEAYIAATDAGARAEWLAEPPAPPTHSRRGGAALFTSKTSCEFHIRSMRIERAAPPEGVARARRAPTSRRTRARAAHSP